jgi:VanZ family protein
MKPKPLNFLRWLPALAWMAMIFAFSNQPGGESGAFSKWVLDQLAAIGLDLRAWFGDNAFVVVRKAAHCFEYFVLAGLLFVAMRPWPWPQRAYWVLALTCAYALTDEFHQTFIPLRVGDLQDVLIDSLGAVLMVGLVAAARWVLRKRKSAQQDVSSQRR